MGKYCDNETKRISPDFDECFESSSINKVCFDMTSLCYIWTDGWMYRLAARGQLDGFYTHSVLKSLLNDARRLVDFLDNGLNDFDNILVTFEVLIPN